MNNTILCLKALADETRYKLLQLLLEHDFCVGALSMRLGISEAAVSQHLQVLRKAGLVKGEKRGYYTHYQVERSALMEVGENINQLALSTPPKQSGCHRHARGDHEYCKKVE